MRLVLDHHYPLALVEAMRQRGHDASAIAGLEWHRLDDESLLARCAEAQMILMTYNVADFAVIARQWQAQGRRHAGLICTSDATWPRTADKAARMADALDIALRSHATVETWSDRVVWLTAGVS